MAVELTHVGEAIVVRMIDGMRRRFLDLCGLSDRADKALIADLSGPIAFANVELSGYGGKIFDGTSRVDLVVLIRERLGVPFELKLGTTRLTKKRVDADWLRECRITHKGKRFSGSMIAVLDRKFPPPVPSRPLCARISGREIELTTDWFLIARQQVLDRWADHARPAFSANARFVAFDAIVEAFGGKEPFNELVRGVLNVDYYEKWVAPRRRAVRPRKSEGTKNAPRH